MTDPMPPDHLVETMAQAIHRNYRDANAETLGPDHPANRPWEALDPKLRAQNRHQARDNVAKLALLGIEVVQADEATTDGVELTADQVEELARLEHDRWADQKRQQGYRYGPVRVDDGPDLRHPDLKAWDELDEGVRDKDRSPIEAFGTVLAEAGLAMRHRRP